MGLYASLYFFGRYGCLDLSVTITFQEKPKKTILVMVIVMSMIVMVTVMMMTNTSISSLDLTILCPEVATLMSTSLQSGRAASNFLSISPYMIPPSFFLPKIVNFMHCTPCFSFSINCSEIRIQIVPGTKWVLMLSVKAKASFISLVPRQLARFYSTLSGLTTASSQESFLTTLLATFPHLCVWMFMWSNSTPMFPFTLPSASLGFKSIGTIFYGWWCYEWQPW